MFRGVSAPRKSGRKRLTTHGHLRVKRPSRLLYWSRSVGNYRAVSFTQQLQQFELPSVVSCGGLFQLVLSLPLGQRHVTLIGSLKYLLPEPLTPQRAVRALILFRLSIHRMDELSLDWNLSSSSGGGGINTYKNKEHKDEKKGKKRIQTYPKADWSPVLALSLHGMHCEVESGTADLEKEQGTGLDCTELVTGHRPDESLHKIQDYLVYLRAVCIIHVIAQNPRLPRLFAICLLYSRYDTESKNKAVGKIHRYYACVWPVNIWLFSELAVTTRAVYRGNNTRSDLHTPTPAHVLAMCRNLSSSLLRPVVEVGTQSTAYCQRVPNTLEFAYWPLKALQLT
ncbi:hypothetical protein J6590_017283 [Homalodisca vitripennis]|nr:hypothetical protein J6590_017283 [Homalodisca vitripennis]